MAEQERVGPNWQWFMLTLHTSINYNLYLINLKLETRIENTVNPSRNCSLQIYTQ